MKCPKCADRSEVLETHRIVDAGVGEYTMRRRRCLNPKCAHRFKTRESPMTAPDVITTEGVMKTLKIEKRTGSRYDGEALAAAVAVDKRRAQIKREQRRKARDDEWESEQWDRAPRKLTREQLRNEIEGY